MPDPVQQPPPAAPTWCSYPEPTRPAVGCWSWLNGTIHRRADCRDCECVMQEAPADG
jgi:hypothetical protein